MSPSAITRAVVATAFGGPEVLSVIETPVGRPGPGEVLLEVRAAGTNPIDYKLYSGAIGRDPAQLPIRIGLEAAGVVTDVGGGAAGPGGPVRAGDEVVGFRIAGAYAVEVVVPAASVVPKPSTLSFEQASGMMLTGMTAVHAPCSQVSRRWTRASRRSASSREPTRKPRSVMQPGSSSPKTESCAW